MSYVNKTRHKFFLNSSYLEFRRWHYYYDICGVTMIGIHTGQVKKYA